VKLTTHLHLVP